MALQSTARKETSLEFQARLCKQYDIDFEGIESLNKLVYSVLRSLGEKWDCFKTIRTAIKKIGDNLDGWKEIHSLTNGTISPKQKSILELFLYLQLVEGTFSEIASILSFLLIENGHDLFSDIPRPKFIESYEEVGDSSLFLRELFLEKHGFASFMKAVDRPLRNCIAHLDYDIDDDGMILNRKTGLQVKELVAKNDRLGAFCVLMMVSIVDAVDRVQKLEVENVKAHVKAQMVKP